MLLSVRLSFYNGDFTLFLDRIMHLLLKFLFDLALNWVITFEWCDQYSGSVLTVQMSKIIKVFICSITHIGMSQKNTVFYIFFIMFVVLWIEIYRLITSLDYLKTSVFLHHHYTSIFYDLFLLLTQIIQVSYPGVHRECNACVRDLIWCVLSVLLCYIYLFVLFSQCLDNLCRAINLMTMLIARKNMNVLESVLSTIVRQHFAICYGQLIF